MMANFRMRLLGASLALSVVALGCGPSPGGPLVAVEVEASENTLDGCTACGCRVKGGLEPGAEREWWISFGLVAADAHGGWEALGSSSHCGSGTFESVSADFGRTLGAPYVVLELSTTAAALPAAGVDIEARSSIRKLSGFDEHGQAVYARSAQKRRLSFSGGDFIALPLLIADRRERESFGVHEVLVRLRASALGRELAAAYGRVAVSADVPGAEVLLDGGFVGRIADGGPTLLENVPVGSREIRVRDFSAREAHRQVVVEPGVTVEVALEVLDPSPAGSRDALVPIGENPQGYDEYWRTADDAMLVRIPAGEFLMGSAGGQGEPDERPQHQVDVSEFLIDKTEVTWRQFRKFAEANGSPLPPTPVGGAPGDQPAVFVLWEEAQAYCEWAGGRLPSEAEWEKAARGTEGWIYAWGHQWDPTRCNSISGGLHRPESVGSYPGCVSPYGVLDMPGSMWEWCADWYGESYYRESPTRDPKGPTSGRLRVMRGGAWMSQPLWLRVAHRVPRSPSSRNLDHGFRCAQDAPERLE